MCRTIRKYSFKYIPTVLSNEWVKLGEDGFPPETLVMSWYNFRRHISLCIHLGAFFLATSKMHALQNQWQFRRICCMAVHQSNSSSRILQGCSHRHLQKQGWQGSSIIQSKHDTYLLNCVSCSITAVLSEPGKTLSHLSHCFSYVLILKA